MVPVYSDIPARNPISVASTTIPISMHDGTSAQRYPSNTTLTLPQNHLPHRPRRNSRLQRLLPAASLHRNRPRSLTQAQTSFPPVLRLRQSPHQHYLARHCYYRLCERWARIHRRYHPLYRHHAQHCVASCLRGDCGAQGQEGVLQWLECGQWWQLRTCDL
jgi:hypothetical protein